MRPTVRIVLVSDRASATAVLIPMSWRRSGEIRTAEYPDGAWISSASGPATWVPHTGHSTDSPGVTTTCIGHGRPSWAIGQLCITQISWGSDPLGSDPFRADASRLTNFMFQMG